MVKNIKLKKDSIFWTLSCSHLHYSKWNHYFTSQPTRGLANSLAPKTIHVASWPSIFPRPHLCINSSNISETLLILPNFSSSKYLKFFNPFQNSQKYLKKRTTLPISCLLFITKTLLVLIQVLF